MQAVQVTAVHTLDGQTLVILLSVAAVIALLSKRLRLPYTIALVIAGLVLSFFHLVHPVELSEELVLLTLLPALLFEASWNLDVRHLRSTWPTVGLMATFGVVLSISLIGLGLHWSLGFPVLPALLVGAILAPTDPVSVVAIMKQFHLDHRLAATIEAESLFNDGTAVVFFKLMTALLLIGSGVVLNVDFVSGAFVQLVAVIGGGLLVGGMVGGLASLLTSRIDDHLLELALTTIVAYGAFYMAEHIGVSGIVPHLHLSGVLATVTAGLIMGNVARQHGMSATTRIAVSSFWEYAAFFVNSVIFLLVGLEINMASLMAQWPAVMLGVGIVFVSRSISVYGLSFISNRFTGERISSKWQHVLIWAGLRGALSMALVLSLPTSLLSPELRQTIVLIVFGVVLASLLIQGLSMAPLLKKLGLVTKLSDEAMAYEKEKSLLRVEKAALAKLKAMFESHEISGLTYQQLQTENAELVQAAQNRLAELHVNKAWLIEQEVDRARHVLATTRKDALTELSREGLVDLELARALQAELNEVLEQKAHP